MTMRSSRPTADGQDTRRSHRIGCLPPARHPVAPITGRGHVGADSIPGMSVTAVTRLPALPAERSAERAERRTLWQARIVALSAFGPYVTRPPPTPRLSLF